MPKPLQTHKPSIAKMVENVEKLTAPELILLSEEIEKQLKPLQDAKEVLKARFRELLGSQDSMNIMVPSESDPGVVFPFRIYKQFRKRYEPLTIQVAEHIVQDSDLLDVICEPRTVNWDRAKDALPKELYKELEGKRVEMEPIAMIKIGMAKR